MEQQVRHVLISNSESRNEPTSPLRDSVLELVD